MSFEIREIRQSEMQAALALARTLGSEVPTQQVNPALSVSASREGQLVAVLLGLHDRGVRHAMELCVHEDGDHDVELSQALVDAALAKTRRHGIATSRLRIRTAQGEQPLWPGAYW